MDRDNKYLVLLGKLGDTVSVYYDLRMLEIVFADSYGELRLEHKSLAYRNIRLARRHMQQHFYNFHTIN